MEIEWITDRNKRMPGEFFRGMSAKTMSDFESLAAQYSCPIKTVLLQEEQDPTSILILLEGKVNLTMNSFSGKRLILGIAVPGEILGLTSAISGNQSEIGAETRCTCMIALVQRREFLDFLLRHPIATRNVARELSQNYTRACDRMRILGLSSSVPGKLAALLLQWCRSGVRTKSGTKIRCLLTHGEIGECIGASREGVTRTMNEFKSRKLLEPHGSALVIPNCDALAHYAGIG